MLFTTDSTKNGRKCLRFRIIFDFLANCLLALSYASNIKGLTSVLHCGFEWRFKYARGSTFSISTYTGLVTKETKNTVVLVLLSTSNCKSVSVISVDCVDCLLADCVPQVYLALLTISFTFVSWSWKTPFFFQSFLFFSFAPFLKARREHSVLWSPIPLPRLKL